MRYKVTVVTTHHKLEFFAEDHAAETLYGNAVNAMIGEKIISFKTDLDLQGALKGADIVAVVKEPE